MSEVYAFKKCILPFASQYRNTALRVILLGLLCRSDCCNDSISGPLLAQFPLNDTNLWHVNKRFQWYLSSETVL